MSLLRHCRRSCLVPKCSKRFLLSSIAALDTVRTRKLVVRCRKAGRWAVVSRGPTSRSAFLNLRQPCALTFHSYRRVGMMRNPAHSRYECSKAPRPHRSELPGAENSGSGKTSPPVEKAHVEVATDEVDVVLARGRRSKSVEASRFLATTL